MNRPGFTGEFQTVGGAAKLRGNRLVGGRVASIFGAVLSEKPNTAFAQFDRIGGVNLCFVIGLIL